MLKTSLLGCLLLAAGLIAGCVTRPSPATNQAVGRVLLSDGSTRKIVKEVAVAYPDAARWKGREGKVIMRLWIAPDGAVQKCEVRYASDSALVPSAKTAVQQWLFAPAPEGDRRVLMADVPILFPLGKGGSR